MASKSGIANIRSGASTPTTSGLNASISQLGNNILIGRVKDVTQTILPLH